MSSRRRRRRTLAGECPDFGQEDENVRSGEASGRVRGKSHAAAHAHRPVRSLRRPGAGYPLRPAKVADIIARAGVARSTFYEHYRSKDDLLAEGLSGPFGVLADMLTDAHDAQRLTAVIDHFWENRRIGNVLFAGPSRQVAMRTLATLIEQRLAATRGPSTLPMPPSLLAVQLAGGQLALISGWLSGLAPATPGQIATALVGSVRWLTGPPPVQGAMRLTVNVQPDPAPSS